MTESKTLQQQITTVTELISKLNEEKNIHQLLKSQQNIKNEMLNASKSIKKLRKMAEDSESDSQSSSDNSSDSDSESNSSQKKFAASFKNVKSKMDKMKNEDLSIENQIKLKKQLKSELNVLIKLLKNKKITIIEK